MCGHVDDRRRDGSDLMRYNYEGSFRVWIPQIGVRDITFYEGSVPAPAMVRSNFVIVDLAFFWFSPSVLGTEQDEGVQEASNNWFVVSNMVKDCD